MTLGNGPSCGWNQNSRQINCCAHRCTVIRSAWIRKRCSGNPPCSTKVPLNVQNQSLSETPLDVSVPWPMTLDVVWVAGYLLRFLSLVLNEAPMAGDHFAVWRWKISTCNPRWRTCQTCSDETTSSNQRVSLENLWYLEGWEVKSGNVIIKADVQGVRLKPLLPPFKRLKWKVWKWPSFLSTSWCDQRSRTVCRSTNAFIIGFNVRLRHKHPWQKLMRGIRLHSIIYKVIEEMEDAMKECWILSSKKVGKQLFVKPLGL